MQQHTPGLPNDFSAMRDEDNQRYRGAPFFHKHEMEIESGYPSESDAKTPINDKNERHILDSSVEKFEVMNESRISYSPAIKARVPQDMRFRIFQSLGFQGNPHDALHLICLSLR